MTAASAYPPPPADQAEARGTEPSMEDILASIRRIISDDQGSKAAASRRLPAEDERAGSRTRTPYDDVLDLARLVPSADASAGRPAPSPEANPAHALQDAMLPEDDSYEQPVSSLRARLAEPAPRASAPEREAAAHPLPALSHDADEDLLSPPLGDSVMSAFETLAATVVLQNKPMLESVMRDVLRPLVKTWLDDNLPALVERLVRGEIERVARGNRP